MNGNNKSLPKEKAWDRLRRRAPQMTVLSQSSDNRDTHHPTAEDLVSYRAAYRTPSSVWHNLPISPWGPQRPEPHTKEQCRESILGGTSSGPIRNSCAEPLHLTNRIKRIRAARGPMLP